MPYITQTAAGIRKELSIFGDDYETPDGTGVRDYIHITDLARGHIAAIGYTEEHVDGRLSTSVPATARACSSWYRRLSA